MVKAKALKKRKIAFLLLESTVFRGQVGCDVFAKAKVVAEWPWTWPRVHTNTLTVMANMAVAWAIGDILKFDHILSTSNSLEDGLE